MNPQAHGNNYAFIDAQNVHLGIKQQGWQLDWAKFRIYLNDKLGVTKAFLFMGYIAKNQPLYTKLQDAGYIVIFKAVSYDGTGKPKGNVDAELIVEAMKRTPEYDGAVLVSGDGDFAVLVRYLADVSKFKRLVAPNKHYCSSLLRVEAGSNLQFLNDLQHKLARKERTP